MCGRGNGRHLDTDSVIVSDMLIIIRPCHPQVCIFSYNYCTAFSVPLALYKFCFILLNLLTYFFLIYFLIYLLFPE